MSTDVRVPTTGNAGEDAVIVDWKVAEGAEVSAGEVLVILETAKSTIDVEAPESGQILKIRYAIGDEVPEHEILAVIGQPGERVEDSASSPETPAADSFVESALAPVVAPAPATSDRLAVSPRARLLAERNSIDLDTVAGTGPGGRIIVGDVLVAKKKLDAAPVSTVTAPPIEPATASTADPTDSVIVPVRGARKVTAQRMQDSLQQSAQVTLTRYAKADALLAYVGRLRAVTEATSRPKIGVNDVLLFATARAVARHPEANSWFSWDGIRQFGKVNLGFAVDTGEALLVPVIPNADDLSLAEVAAAARAAIDKSRAGKLTPDEMNGGTFTVSNLGSLGVHWFTPVLNPPQTCILGVGATHQLHPEGGSLLPLSLTFDHRAIDGATAAVVLGEIVSAIETVDVLAAF
jgi:pyruvate dehydrogenase E2 component (dihydrolipoamide acetyltransferase)